jgi:hypothetical protein
VLSIYLSFEFIRCFVNMFVNQQCSHLTLKMIFFYRYFSVLPANGIFFSVAFASNSSANATKFFEDVQKAAGKFCISLGVVTTSYLHSFLILSVGWLNHIPAPNNTTNLTYYISALEADYLGRVKRLLLSSSRVAVCVTTFCYFNGTTCGADPPCSTDLFVAAPSFSPGGTPSLRTPTTAPSIKLPSSSTPTANYSASQVISTSSAPILAVSTAGPSTNVPTATPFESSSFPPSQEIYAEALSSGVAPPPTSGYAPATMYPANLTLLNLICNAGSPENVAVCSQIAHQLAQQFRIDDSEIEVIAQCVNGSLIFNIIQHPGITATPNALCSFGGDVSFNVSVPFVVVIAIGPFSSSVTSWVSSQTGSLSSIPVGIIVSLVLALCLLFGVLFYVSRRCCPKVKMMPIVSLLLCAPGFITKLQFIAYLKSLIYRSDFYTISTCAMVIPEPSKYHADYFVAYCVAVFLLASTILFNWIGAFLIQRSQYKFSKTARYNPFDYMRELTDSQADSKSSKQAIVQYHNWFDKAPRQRWSISVLFSLFAGLNVDNLMILRTRICRLNAFSAPFSLKTVRFIEVGSLFTLLYLQVPFMGLQIWASVAANGWQSSVVGALTLGVLQTMMSIVGVILWGSKIKKRAEPIKWKVVHSKSVEVHVLPDYSAKVVGTLSNEEFVEELEFLDPFVRHSKGWTPIVMQDGVVLLQLQQGSAKPSVSTQDITNSSQKLAEIKEHVKEAQDAKLDVLADKQVLLLADSLFSLQKGTDESATAEDAHFYTALTNTLSSNELTQANALLQAAHAAKITRLRSDEALSRINLLAERSCSNQTAGMMHNLRNRCSKLALDLNLVSREATTSLSQRHAASVVFATSAFRSLELGELQIYQNRVASLVSDQLSFKCSIMAADAASDCCQLVADNLGVPSSSSSLKLLFEQVDRDTELRVNDITQTYTSEEQEESQWFQKQSLANSINPSQNFMHEVMSQHQSILNALSAKKASQLAELYSRARFKKEAARLSFADNRFGGDLLQLLAKEEEEYNRLCIEEQNSKLELHAQLRLRKAFACQNSLLDDDQPQFSAFSNSSLPVQEFFSDNAELSITQLLALLSEAHREKISALFTKYNMRRCLLISGTTEHSVLTRASSNATHREELLAQELLQLEFKGDEERQRLEQKDQQGATALHEKFAARRSTHAPNGQDIGIYLQYRIDIFR